MKRKLFITWGISLVLLFAIVILYVHDRSKIGKEIDSYNNIMVYYNGFIYTQSYGKNYSEDEYYFGYKWQCVEFVKRFYYQAKGHKMPDTLGNAKDFFSLDTKQGGLNDKRGLIQYYNGGDVAPEAEDLLVFTDTKYGHVAIVTEVTENDIEVIQQNVYGKTRQRHLLVIKDGRYYVGKNRTPAGWLRYIGSIENVGNPAKTEMERTA